MASNLDRFKADLDKLIALGESFLLELLERAAEKKTKRSFEEGYHAWYSEALEVVSQLLPARLDEFVNLYERDLRRKSVNAITYTIQDFLLGLRPTENQYTGEKAFEEFSAVVMRFQSQLGILKACSARFQSSLFDIRQLVQADLLDSQVDESRELIKNGFFRAAGAVCGVVLEKHLRQVCVNHTVQLKNKDSTIAVLNDALKGAGVYDTPQWRQVQRLGDIRNLCDHSKDREPTKDEVVELADGADRLLKTLF